ncbi:hypothetical protein BASA60_008361 [Batrachochytrium salamandrivorans]|nr:hypothetical protein BASA60_008361 [Batrachochytrium salamandrivorans]
MTYPEQPAMNANQQRAENKEGCFMDAAMYCIASSCGFQSCIGCMGRGHVRAVSNITNDSSVADCLTHLCCSPCALTQEKRELDIIGK